MIIEPGSTIGILGGGQLGKMMVTAASTMGYKTVVYSNHEDSPAFDVAAKSMLADYDDEALLEEFESLSDVITVEFENIPYQTALFLEKRCPFRPNAKSLYMTQNRLREKDFAKKLGIETAPYKEVKDLKSAVKEMGMPCILKTVEEGYDGKGQYLIDENTDLERIELRGGILEKKVPFKMEISVVAARKIDGEFASFVPVQNVHKMGILDRTIAPAKIEKAIENEAVNATKKLMDALEYVGTFAVEFFVTEKGGLLMNEFACRPHNSGHWTIDACYTSQFEQHIRAICNLPLGDAAYHHAATMKNLIGEEISYWSNAVKDPMKKLHLYGKKENRKGRKVGHITKLLEKPS